MGGVPGRGGFSFGNNPMNPADNTKGSGEVFGTLGITTPEIKKKRKKKKALGIKEYRRLPMVEEMNPVPPAKKRKESLYHGSKSGSKMESPDFSLSNYFYLTNNKPYALSYARGNEEGLTEFSVDTSNMVNLIGLGTKKMKFKDIAKEFKAETGAYFPSYMQKWDGSALWEYVRYDVNGMIKRALQAAGYDGLIMQEEKDGRSYDSYVLFNEKPLNEALGLEKPGMEHGLYDGKGYEEAIDKLFSSAIRDRLWSTAKAVLDGKVKMEDVDQRYINWVENMVYRMTPTQVRLMAKRHKAQVLKEN
jgi:hypothetical protein